MIPTETIDKLEHTWRSISDLCASLTEEQWKTQSQLPAWTVQDNLSHMVGTERGMEGMERLDHVASDLSHTKNPIGEANEHDVDARRAWTGAQVLAEWNDVITRRIATLRNADEAYFAQESFTPTGPGTLADFLHIRVLDCWTHEQDMRRALGLKGNQGSASAEHTIDRLIRTIPIVVGKRAQTPEGGTVIIEITGAVQRRVATTVIDGRAQMVPDAPGDALCTISMDSDVFLQLATGRAGAGELGSGITIDGDATLGDRVVGQFNMMI